ncbi:MAG: TRAP transporter permease [Deinococcales bacterium]
MSVEVSTAIPKSPLGRITTVLLIVASLYSLFLVIEPFTPISNADLPLFDIIQIQRATHVFFLVCIGYLVSIFAEPVKRTTGTFVFAGLSLIFLFTFWVPNGPGLNIDLEAKLFGTLAWTLAVVPLLVPKLQKPASLIAALMALVPLIYQMAFFNDLVNRAVIPTSWDVGMSFALIFLVLGVVYRFIGPVMPSLVLFFVAYNLYGNFFPGAFQGAKSPIDVILGKTFNETEAGIYGQVTGVSAKYLVYFTILSGIISSLGLGKVVANLALAMVGRKPATPGRVTAISSVFMGMFSGSGAADTQFVATLTKPLFESSKYNTMTAAGLVATSGTIAIITPPVLGSIAFIMVENLSIPYLDVIVMSIGPCLLYLLAIISFNELYTRKAKLEPSGALMPRGYVLRYSSIFVPILVIITLLYNGYEVATAASIAAVMFIAIAYIDPTLRAALPSKGIKPILEGLRDGFRSLLPIGTAVTAANLVFAMLVISGLASKISQFLEQVSSGNLIIACLLTAILSLVLGMGVPPTATYVLTSALTAPAIIGIAWKSYLAQLGFSAEQITKLGVTSVDQLKTFAGNTEQLALLGVTDAQLGTAVAAFGAATLATHMFLFYYAVLADVTPPVALSAFAAASVFKTNPIRTGVYAARVALSKYLVGFFFLIALSGAGLLILPILRVLPSADAIRVILERFLTVGVGIVLLSSATVGYTRRNLERWESWVVGAAALGCFVPSLPLNLLCIAIGVGFFIWKGRATPNPEVAVSSQ